MAENKTAWSRRERALKEKDEIRYDQDPYANRR